MKSFKYKIFGADTLEGVYGCLRSELKEWLEAAKAKDLLAKSIGKVEESLQVNGVKALVPMSRNKKDTHKLSIWRQSSTEVASV
ncbi:hypothetical protein [Microbulbifer sp. JSM ZJ756]|uniref:hypothetical protein n=1 Tax=Microbulbifer sp. JSM ZJ756 TaxID=3376191 RepID=UPI0037B2A3D8